MIFLFHKDEYIIRKEKVPEGGKIENKPDGLFSINSFVLERHKTVWIADEKTHMCFLAATEAKTLRYGGTNEKNDKGI